MCCPSSRIPFEEVRKGAPRPYLFGEAQRPACVQCRNDTLWAHMCLYESHGPVCPRADQERLTREFVGWCAADPRYTLEPALLGDIARPGMPAR